MFKLKNIFFIIFLFSNMFLNARTSESVLYESIFKFRSKFKLKKLEIDKTLEKVAKEYAPLLNEHKVLTHTLFNTTPLERVRKYDSSFYIVKEILASGYEESEVVEEGWNKSKPHKKALLSTDISRIGGYVLKTKDKENIFVVIFGEKK